MNIYFVLEGEKTEDALYPHWMNFFIPHLTKVDFESEVKEDNYYVFSGGGIPSIYQHTVNAIKNINDNPVFDHLIVCLDSEDLNIESRVNAISDYIEKSGVSINNTCDIHFVIQHICIETWLLGNRKMIKRNPQNQKLISFLEYYNVREKDPEHLEGHSDYRTKAHFHFAYLKEALKERNISFSKSRPYGVVNNSFLNELIVRTNETNHLSQLKAFFDLLTSLNKRSN